MSNTTIDQVLLDAIVRQGGPRLTPHQVEITRLPDSDHPGQPRKFKVQVLPPLNEVIKDFTIVMQPNALNRQLSGGSVLAFPQAWTPQTICAALKEHVNVDLLDDTFEVVTLDTGRETVTRLVCNNQTMLFDGEIVLISPNDAFKMLEATNGGMNTLTTAAQLAEINHSQRLGRVHAALPNKWPNRIDRVLFCTRREPLAGPLAVIQTLGGPDNPHFYEFPIEVDSSQVDLNSHYLCGDYSLTLEQSTDTVIAQLFNVDADGTRLLSWEGKLNGTSGWDAIPITAESSVLVLTHSAGTANTTSIGVRLSLSPYRQVYMTQTVEEYAPEMAGPSLIRFSGFERLESDLMELSSTGHFIGARVHVLTLPTTGVTKIISVEGQDDPFLSLEYDAADRSFLVRYGEIVQKASVDWAAFEGAHITVAANIGNQTINVFVQGQQGQGQMIDHINPVGPSSGRIRVGGGSEQSISLRDFFHFKGKVTVVAAQWFVDNHNQD